MSVAFQKGQATGASDLKITIRDSMGNLADPYSISYSVFDFTSGVEVLMGEPNQIPESTGVGEFYAHVTIPLDANIGDWVIRWSFMETVNSPILQAIQNFNVVDSSTIVSASRGFQRPQLSFLDSLIRRLRISLRDNNPDRNYRFRPPSTEKFLQTQTEVFGYIWEDEELYYYLLETVYDFNSAGPATDITLDSLPDNWSAAIIVGAGARACRAIALNWIADEFDYSISGVSLNIDKSSKYMAMKENLEQSYDKLKEEAKETIKIVKGLKQPRFGIGINAALGPYSRVGVQSRRNYVSSGGGYWM
jgi:hypothetical protein